MHIRKCPEVGEEAEVGRQESFINLADKDVMQFSNGELVIWTGCWKTLQIPSQEVNYT